MYKVLVVLFCVCLGLGAFKVYSAYSGVSKEEMQTGIASSFKDQTGYDVKEVELLKQSGNEYTGYVTLDKDGSKAAIDVTIDADDNNHYMWKVTTPSPTMIADAFQQAADSLAIEAQKGLEEIDTNFFQQTTIN